MRNVAVTLQRYDQLAQINRPRDESSLARECSRLRSTGLTARDIATALRLDLGTVLGWLQRREPLGFDKAAEAHARVWEAADARR